MIKFHELDAYKVAANVGYCTCASALHNGMLVSANLATKVAALPTSGTAKGEMWLVMNRIDKPETWEPNDYTVAIGEFPRLFNLKSIAGKTLDADTDQVTTAYASIVVGSKLTGGTDGKLVVTADVDLYETYLEVLEKTTFGGSGLLLLVVDNTAAAKANAAQSAATELPVSLGTAGQVLTVNGTADDVEWTTLA